MESEFWQELWAKNEIGFHEYKANDLLVEHFEKLNLGKGSRVFVPLCGKAVDMAWLLSQGQHVLGSELSETAIEQFFDELGVQATIEQRGGLTQYSAENIDIFVGDIFDLNAGLLGTVDATYDRAALVALPDGMRSEYRQHLINITDTAKQLLITFEYDQSEMNGPPFSIGIEQVRQYYSSVYEITPLETKPFPGKLKGICDAVEHICLLDDK